MIDRGLSVAEVEGLLEVAGDSVDVVKLGWGTALVSANLRPKLERYAAHGIPVVLGGTLTELAIRYLQAHGLLGQAARFDVLALSWPPDRREPIIAHYRNAFDAVGRFQMFQ